MRTEYNPDAATRVPNGTTHQRANRIVNNCDTLHCASQPRTFVDGLLKQRGHILPLHTRTREALRPSSQYSTLEALLLARKGECEGQTEAMAKQILSCQEQLKALCDKIEQLEEKRAEISMETLFVISIIRRRNLKNFHK